MMKSKKREEWQTVLRAELDRWRFMTKDQLLAELEDALAYVVFCDNKEYQVEVAILENTDNYVRVAVSVDDGTIPASLHPLSDSFLCMK
jgi:hypothetical protein